MTTASQWWSQRRLIGWYTKPQPWTAGIVDAVLAGDPARVIEFGCNAGRHLRAIRARSPRTALVGIDINGAAVDWGRSHWGLDLRLGDETLLEPDSCDVVFTVSVVDHIPQPERALAALCLAAPTVILVEPWLGREGEVESHNPYTYSWDYPTRLRALGMTVTDRPFPLSEVSIGPAYRMYRATRD